MDRSIYFFTFLAVALVALCGSFSLSSDCSEAAAEPGPGDVGYQFTVDHLTYRVIFEGEVEVFSFEKNAVTSVDILSSVSDGSSNYVVTAIGNDAFAYSNKLVDVSIPDSVVSLGDDCFRDVGCSEISLPDSVVSIGDYAFAQSDLKSFVFPNGVQSFGDSIFYCCYSLQSVTLSDSFSSLPYGLFQFCTSLKSVDIPDCVTSIEDFVFYDCSNLNSLSIPDSVISIGSNVFGGCSSLHSLVIPDSVSTLSDYAFSQFSGLVSIEIPDSVSSLGHHLFSHCSSLESVVLPSGLTTIVEGMFYSCSSLYSISIPSGVEFIGANAFTNCIALSSITIPSSVDDIRRSAFDGCSSLNTLIFESECPILLDSAFHTGTTIQTYTPGWNPVVALADYVGDDGSTTIVWANQEEELVVSIGEFDDLFTSGDSVSISVSLNVENCEISLSGSAAEFLSYSEGFISGIIPDVSESVSYDLLVSVETPGGQTDSSTLNFNVEPVVVDPEPGDPVPSGDAPVADSEIIGIPGTAFWIAAGLLLLVIVLAVCGHAGGRRR